MERQELQHGGMKVLDALGLDLLPALFRRLRGDRVRIGMTDLKIAAITLVYDATLVSGNL